jgi:hypothetical protein
MNGAAFIGVCLGHFEGFLAFPVRTTQIKEFTPAAWGQGQSKCEKAPSGSLSKPIA